MCMIETRATKLEERAGRGYKFLSHWREALSPCCRIGPWLYLDVWVESPSGPGFHVYLPGEFSAKPWDFTPVCDLFEVEYKEADQIGLDRFVHDDGLPCVTAKWIRVIGPVGRGELEKGLNDA